MPSKPPNSVKTPVTPDQHQASSAVSINQQPVDLLPHEQDQSTKRQAVAPRKIMKQAAADVGRGLKDTDRGVEVGKTYAKQKR